MKLGLLVTLTLLATSNFNPGFAEEKTRAGVLKGDRTEVTPYITLKAAGTRGSGTGRKPGVPLWAMKRTEAFSEFTLPSEIQYLEYTSAMRSHLKQMQKIWENRGLRADDLWKAVLHSDLYVAGSWSGCEQNTYEKTHGCMRNGRVFLQRNFLSISAIDEIIQTILILHLGAFSAPGMATEIESMIFENPLPWTGDFQK